MSRIITFSRTFPAYHLKKGEQTLFVEKLMLGFPPFEQITDLFSVLPLALDRLTEIYPKYHTIRSGSRWKIGDKFSPRVWSGKPYASKMITIAPDIEIKQIWTFECDENGVISVGGFYCDTRTEKQIAKNDGLSLEDFKEWLVMPCFKSKKPFKGQIICWNENLEY